MIMIIHRVMSVDSNVVKLKDKATGNISTIPYGMCVWSTGIAPRQLTSHMIDKIQNEKKA